MSQIADDLPYRITETSLARKALTGLMLLALTTAAVGFGGRQIGQSLSLAGRSEETGIRSITIGDDTIEVASNMIRQERARRDGLATRLDLYVRWPEMDGYASASRAAFDDADAGRSLIFMSFEPRAMSRDMSGRLETVYRALIEPGGTPGLGGTTSYRFEKNSGYGEEELVVGQRDGMEPFVARCLIEAYGEETLSPCERDVSVGSGLSLTYRFSRTLLADWQKMDAAVTGAASAMVRNSG
ncbi:MAG: hypothetical protein INR68_13305 [Methylobacterium mesophilicum]|nr:hypothetical protein [Methylobacterium mesophilicum]